MIFTKGDIVGQILRDLDFPADKQTIVNFVNRLNTHDCKEILNVMEDLDDWKRYGKVSEVPYATRLVEE